MKPTAHHSSGTGRSRSRSERGVTMVELLVVMAIFAVLMGGGVGAFLALTSTGVMPTTRNRFVSFVQMARNSARGDQLSTVIVENVALASDDKKSQIRGLIQKESGVWHFEDKTTEGTTGAFRRNGKIDGPSEITSGKIGNALELIGAMIDCGAYADFDVTDGIFVETWIRPSESIEMTIAEKRGSWRFWLEPDGDGRFNVHLQLRLAGLNGRGTDFLPVLVTERAMVRVGRWSEVSFSFDGQRALIHVDRVERAVYPERPEIGVVLKPLPRRTLAVDRSAGLTIGSPDAPLVAAVDEFRIAGVLSEDVWPVPSEVLIDPVILHFKNQKLDTEFHPGPVKVKFRRGKRVLEMEIGLSGAVLKR